MTLLLVLQLLSPAAAARVVAAIDSPANFTGRFVCVDCTGPIVIYGPRPDVPLVVGPIAPLTRDSGVVYRVRIDRPRANRSRERRW